MRNGVRGSLANTCLHGTITDMRHVFIITAIWLIGLATARPQIAPIPEANQAALATEIINSYCGQPANQPRKLYVAYFTPCDRDSAPNYEQRLAAIMEDIQAFYRNGMEQHGFGPKTFPLERDAQGKLIIHLVKGKEPEKNYAKPDGEKVAGECRPMLKAAGISLDSETVLIFCNLATWNETTGTFSHHSPYYGMWTQTNGLCFAVDSVIQNLDDIPRKAPMLMDDEYGKMSLGKFNTIFIGGIAHELGHAFALPHCGERWDEKAFGTSIMGVGNHTYREERRGEGKGSFLTISSAMHLAGRPLFNGSDKGMDEPAKVEHCDLDLSTNLIRADLAARRGALRVEGSVTGSPAIYGVIAYFDSVRDGGYHAPTATSVPDAQGRFAIEVSDLAPCENGELRIEFCHANGAVSEARLGFSVDPEGRVDLSQWQLRKALEPLADAVANNQPDVARTAFQNLNKSQASELAKTIGRNLVGTFESGPKPIPAEVPIAISQFYLGNARTESAEVGWLQPMANRVPLDRGIDSPLLDSGKLYATGLYAHAPSKYVFKLDGKWRELSGDAGLHTLQQPYGSVIFIIKADGREVFRSAIIRHDKKASYKINVAGVKTLELIVDPAGDGNHNDWGIWLDPVLSR
jgi:hypothetical protein